MNPSPGNPLFRALRGLWRWIGPIRRTHGAQRLKLPGKYLQFHRQWKEYKRAGGIARFDQLDLSLFDADPSTQSGGGHYFFQDIWALRKLAHLRPAEHHDVGSRLDGFVGQATAICPVIYWDIRKPSFSLPGFTFRQGSILELPLADRSVASLSCLHTAEHIGLGRYGDPIDPGGTEKALAELCRVLAPGGQFLYSMPVGVEQTAFNSMRIWPPRRPIQWLNPLKLIEFSAVTDAGEFRQNISPDELAQAKCACGLYHFQKPLD